MTTESQTTHRDGTQVFCQHGAYADLCITCWPTVTGWLKAMEAREHEHFSDPNVECSECGHIGTGSVPGCPCIGCDVR